MNKRRLLISLGLLAAPALAAPQGGGGQSMRTLSGTLAFAEPVTLPAAARVRVELVDLRRALTLAVAEWPLDRRKAPLPFALPYFLGDALPGPHYRLRASVVVGDRPVFVTLAPMPVLRARGDRSAALILDRAGPAADPTVGADVPPLAVNAPPKPPAPVPAAVPAPPSAVLPETPVAPAVTAPPPVVEPAPQAGPALAGAAQGPSEAPAAQPAEPSVALPRLEDSYWRLTEIDGQPVRPVPGGREPHLVLFAGRVNANSGCNKLLAPYTLPAAGVLRLGTLASTRMACPEGYAGQEAAYTAALQAATRYQVDGKRLTLGDDDTAARLRFEAREIR